MWLDLCRHCGVWVDGMGVCAWNVAVTFVRPSISLVVVAIIKP